MTHRSASTRPCRNEQKASPLPLEEAAASSLSRCFSSCSLHPPCDVSPHLEHAMRRLQQADHVRKFTG